MITKAILKINPNAKVNVINDDGNIDNCTINWLEGTTPIPKDDIEAKIPEVEFDQSMANLRRKRNIRLSETDFHGMSDRTMSAEMATYRQELRDLTNGITTKEQAEAVVFPTKP